MHDKNEEEEKEEGKSGMASLRYASYVEEEDWDIETLEVVNSHLEKYVKMLPGASAADLTLSELQGLAARQQAAMETQQQALVARETRLKYLQQQEARHRQLASETVRLQRIREKVEAQELKLKKLRAVHGQVEQYKTSNGNLTDSELEAVKALFNEKEKELAVASSRVDVLNQQLKEAKAMVLITTNGSTVKGDPHALALELDRLRQELVHRNKLNEHQNSHLAAQRQLLKQRKDEAAKMDARIHELQQRLKKRRSQQQLQPNAKVGDKNVEQNLPGSRLQSQGRKPGPPNVAAVEPYIQYAPKDVVKDDLYSKTGFQKQDPKYQTLPHNTKFIPPGDDSSKPGGVAGNQEVNNNDKNRGNGVSGVKPVEFKIPALISSHFSAHRGQSGSAANRTPTDSPVSGAGVADSSKSSSQPSAQGSGSSSTPQQLVNKLPKGPRPFVNTFGKSGLPKWPPEPKKDEDTAPKPASHQLPPHHPQINIFDEERQAGSGQSSPASSEGSGPLVKQGSGVFVHPLAASSQNPPATSTNQTGSGPPQENKFLGQPGSPLDFRGVAGLQEPKPPPNTPQGSSLVNPVDQGSNRAANVKPGARGGDDPDSSRLSGNDSVNVGMPQATSTPQGAEGKTGSTVHLNQRPAPTYRYASKNVIANTYMGRLGSSALERYQQLNKQLYSTIDSTQGNNAQTQQPAQKPNQKKTLANELRAAFNTQQQEPSENLAGDSQGGMTQFGLVGAPNYPDIASDKGSFKSNTPKHIRRRHSDSDSEDAGKAFHRGDKSRQQNSQSEDGSNNSNVTQNSSTTDAETKTSNAAQRRRTNSESGGKSKNTSSNQESGTTDSKTKVVAKQKKTILKGDNRRKSNNRVSFDPLALLLDASLEGELDLVTRTAKEVADVSAPNDEGITALHNAICAGHYDIVKFLIEFGADVNSPDSDGWTPLHCAASCNNLPMVQFLVEHGACIFATTISDNETAAEKCEEDEDGYDGCSDYLYSTQEKLGIANDGTVYAVFDYYACNQDEVSFRINTKMTVLRKGDDVEKEWWWARLTPNKEGYIPRNLLGLHPRVIPSDYQPHETSDC